MICISARVISPLKIESVLLILNSPLVNTVSTAYWAVLSDEADLLLGSGSGVQAGAVFLSVPAL